VLFPATIAGRFASNARLADKTTRPQAYHFARVIPEIDIWHAANLMVKRYGDRPDCFTDRTGPVATPEGDPPFRRPVYS